MSNSAEFTINDAEFLRSMKKIEKDIMNAPTLALRKAGEEIITLATPLVPKKTGSLRKRGTAQIVEDDVWVGYNMKYAAWLHEHPELKFKEPGTGAKFLENPVKRNLTRVIKLCTEEWRKRLK